MRAHMCVPVCVCGGGPRLGLDSGGFSVLHQPSKTVAPLAGHRAVGMAATPEWPIHRSLLAVSHSVTMSVTYSQCFKITRRTLRY